MRDVWKSVSMRPGAPSVMDCGQPMMLMLLAGSWDMLQQVSRPFDSEFMSSQQSVLLLYFRFKGIHKCLLWSRHRTNLLG